MKIQKIHLKCQGCEAREAQGLDALRNFLKFANRDFNGFYCIKKEAEGERAGAEQGARARSGERGERGGMQARVPYPTSALSPHVS